MGRRTARLTDVVVNVLDGIGARLDRLPARWSDDAIDEFIAIAERHGGRMMGRYQLTARPTKRKESGDYLAITMQGVPVGFWVWREEGIQRHPIRAKKRATDTGRPAAMGGELNHPMYEVIHPGVPAKKSWTATVDEAAAAIDRLTARLVDRLAA